MKERLARSQQHDDGVVVDMVEIPAGLRQAAAGELGEEQGGGGQVEAWGGGEAAAPWPSLYRRPGVRTKRSLGSATKGAVAPKATPRV